MDVFDVREAAMQLREHYPDDDDFAAAMKRLEGELAGDEGGVALTEQQTRRAYVPVHFRHAPDPAFNDPRVQVALAEWALAGYSRPRLLVEQAGAPAREDDAHFELLKDVAIASRRSSNGHTYSEAVLKALPRWVEGCFVYEGHHGPERPVGMIVQSYFHKRSERVRGGLLLDCSHPVAPLVKRAYKECSGRVGLSLLGEVVKQFDLQEQAEAQVVQVRRIDSVDLIFSTGRGRGTACASTFAD